MSTILRKLKSCSVCNKLSVLWRCNPNLCKHCSLQSKGKSGDKNKPNDKNTGKYIKYKRKTTGERELFLSIWLKRVHICENCGKYLGDEPLTFYFSHIKGKGAYPELRLVEDNIELLCLTCHRAWELDKEGYYKRKKPIIENDR